MAASPQPSPSRLGRYSVLRRLGIGGMAEVFLARSRGAEGVDKLLVAKRILPDYAENPHFRAMFVDEARVALRLNHPNIVQVYGFESDGPTLLLVMEHVDGPDLGLLVNTLAHVGETVPPPLVAYVLREVARGMHYAHERLDEQGRPLEIVHRDVSPNNVLLSYEGAVKLGDFGIARVRSASFENPGTVRGKYGYMAPEQARGEPVDRRADIYSLGVLLTELLAGRTLFHDVAQGPDVLERVREGRVPDPEALLSDAPEALRAIAVRAMKVDRDERFPTARDVVHALSHYLHGLEAPADAGALEHFLTRVMPPKHASVPPPSGRPPPMPSLAGAPSVTVPGGRARTPPKPLPAQNLVTLPAMLMPSVPAPRVPLVDTAAVLRERVHVAVVAGRLTLPLHATPSRALVHLIGELAFKADATLEWTRDEGFVLVLGVLRPHVDDALRAARLALEILDAARSLATDQDDPDDEVASVMLGMARGVAGCARDAEGTMLSYELVDDAAPLAISLASSARAGEALVAGGLYRIVRRAFVLRDHPSKGGPSGVRAFALERARSRTERDRTSESQGWRLLGRETPLRELRNALVGATVTRQGRATLVTGELGIGKTTLLGAFASAVSTTQGILGESKVIRVDGSVSAHGVRYGFAGQLVRHLLALRHAARGSPPAPAAPPDRPKGPPPLPRRRGSGEVALPGDSLPQLLDQVSERYGQGPAGRRAAMRVLRVCLGMELEEVGAEASTTRELGLVLRPMLADAARERPLVLIFDALEQADAPSRAVVSELLRKPPAGLVLLAAALRDDDPLTRELAGMQTIALGALDAESRRKLIANALGTDEPSEEVVREVSSVAGGNPLTILEVTEALAERARDRRGGTDPGDGPERYNEASALLRDDDAPLPPSLEEVLTTRLEALSPEARNLLRWCSLCEAELTVDLVDQLGGDEGPRVRGRLISDGILMLAGETPEARATLGFAHPMLARVARNSIEPTVVPAMHARVAELLERRKNLPGARAALVAALARHREAAGAERPAARSWLEAAALYVATAADPREAMHAYGRVLALCRGATDVEGYSLRAAAREGREDLARASGASRPRRTELIALREIAVEARDPRLVARALTRQARYKLETFAADADRDTVAAVRAARRAGEARTEAEARWVLAVYRGRRGMYREALAELEAALTALSTRESTNPNASIEESGRAARALRVEVLLSKAALLRATGITSECVAAVAEAHALAHAWGPRRLLAPTYEELGMACLAQGGYADALRFFRAAVALDRELGSRDRIVASLAHAGQAWAALGQHDRAVAWVMRARDMLTSLGPGVVPAVAVEVYVSLAELLLERGDIEGAVEAVDHARSGVGARESRHALYRVYLGDARLHLARRQYRQARAAAEAAERVARESGMVVEALHGRAYVAEASAGIGDRAAARAWLDSVLGDPHFADPVRVFRGDRVVAACVRALRFMGDSASAEVLEERLSVMRHRVAATAPAGP